MLLFIVCAGCILYILAGYPVALGFLARRRHRPVKKGSELPLVSVIIPIHNGGRFVEEKLKSVFALDYPHERLEVIVVADGCTDDTEAQVRELQNKSLCLISIPHSGKPAALNAGVARASGQILLMTDVRQQLQPDSLRAMAACFEDSEVGVVSGALVFREGTCRDQADVRLYWRYESWIRERLSEIDSMFGATGPFYAMRRSLFVPLPEDILLDDVYLPMMAFLRGYRLIVEPAARATEYPITSAREFGRKVRTLGGNYQLMLRLPALLTRRNRLLWHFLSYKFGRLLLPWLLTMTLATSFLFPAPWSAILICLQVAFYLLAALDPKVPQNFLLKRISSPSHTFVMLMAATIRGLQVLFVPARTMWKVTDIGPIDS
jgi:cellulose synthase/poly-beta-1,6-N-acetylglucosamine synthase-like glycosyltransferase